jgi:hypothetical protein
MITPSAAWEGMLLTTFPAAMTLLESNLATNSKIKQLCIIFFHPAIPHKAIHPMEIKTPEWVWLWVFTSTVSMTATGEKFCKQGECFMGRELAE